MDAVTMARQRILDGLDRHASLVVQAAEASEERRKARERTKSHRRYSRLTAEEKLELSRRKKSRMRELHGDGYFYGLHKAWRRTAKGRACVEAYNHSEKHLECHRRYRERQMAKDREGYLREQRERKAARRRFLKLEALWLLVEWNSNIFWCDTLARGRKIMYTWGHTTLVSASCTTSPVYE